MPATLKGLVDDNNLYEWEVMIIGFVFYLRYLPGVLPSYALLDPPTHSSEGPRVPRVRSDLTFPRLTAKEGSSRPD